MSAVRTPCADSDAYFEKIVLSSRSYSVTLIHGYCLLNAPTSAVKFADGGLPETTMPDSFFDCVISDASGFFGLAAVAELAATASAMSAAAGTRARRRLDFENTWFLLRGNGARGSLFRSGR